MREEHINYTWVGGFVIAALSFLVFVLFQITGGEGSRDDYFVRLNKVTAIETGSQVTFNGYHIGQVEAIVPERIDGKTRYKLRLGIKSGWKIPDDSYARIDAPSLLSEFLLEITEGTSDTYLKPGDFVKGKDAVNIMSAISAMGAEVNDLSANSIQPLLTNINEQISAIGPNIEQSIPKVVDNMNALISDVQGLTGRIGSLFSNKNKRHVDRIFENTEQLSDQLLTMSGEIKIASEKLNNLLQNSNNVVDASDEDIRRAVSELRTSLETISQNIHSIVYNLETTSRNMSEFSRQLRDNPSVIISGKPPEDQAKEHLR